MLLYVTLFVVAYIAGSVPFGVLLARAKSVDIWSVGSGSPGATNINRALGKGMAYLVFFLDFFKGFAVCFCTLKWCSKTPLVGALVLLGAVLGHCFSIFCKFKGGKGVATTIGGLLVLMPHTLTVGLFIWVVLFYATKTVSVASLTFIGSVWLTSYLFGYPKEYQILALLLTLIVFLRHKENISRLLTEREYTFKK